MRRALTLTLTSLWLVACPAKAPGELPDGGVGTEDGGDTQDLSVTWHRDVAPLVQRHCEGCHVEGGIAPFSLRSYAEASPRAGVLSSAVKTGRMPPWMPSADCQSFQDERRLTEAEKDLFVRWANAGAPEGDLAQAPAPFDAGTGLSPISAELAPAEDYTPPTGRADDYHCFVLDPKLGATQDLTGYEIEPGLRRMVHHVILFSTTRADADALEAGEAGAGWTCFGSSGARSETLLGGWVPGSSTVRYPEGTGIPIEAGRVVVMQVHYNLQNGGTGADRTRVKLQYAPARVANPATLLPLANTTFQMLPGQLNYTATQSVTLPPLFSSRLWGVLPHMHTRGKRISVTSTGNGCLVDIPKWDFHWQQLYLYKAPVTLAPGSQVTLRCTWDNPGPTPVSWGEGTDDEMCLSYFYLTQ